MNVEFRKSVLIAIMIPLTFLVASCSTNQSRREMPVDKWHWADGLIESQSDIQQKILIGRFRQFWSHYYWREWEERYQMELPAFRTRFSKDFYAGYYSKAWDVVDFSVTSIETPKAGEAVFFVTFTQKGKLNDKETVIENPLADVWVLDGDTWYHKTNDPMLRY